MEMLPLHCSHLGTWYIYMYIHRFIALAMAIIELNAAFPGQRSFPQLDKFRVRKKGVQTRYKAICRQTVLAGFTGKVLYHENVCELHGP